MRKKEALRYQEINSNQEEETTFLSYAKMSLKTTIKKWCLTGKILNQVAQLHLLSKSQSLCRRRGSITL